MTNDGGPMTLDIPLAVAASLCTATASVSMRKAAAPAPGDLRFSLGLVVFLLRRPVWFFGVACMIGGFGFQLAALHYGDLALVQPVIASELLFVFFYLAVRYRGRVRVVDLVAAAAMAASLGGFLYVADPSGGSSAGATATKWWLSASAVAFATVVAAVVSFLPGRAGRLPTPARRAAALAVSAGLIWGFVAAVVKELSAHVGQGPSAVFENWSPYVLVAAGAVGMYVVSNAFQAGPLAASQPALTVVEPLVATLLGVTLFSEHLRTGIAELVVEAALAALLTASVVVLSHSPLVGGAGEAAHGKPPKAGAPPVKARLEAGRSPLAAQR